MGFDLKTLSIDPQGQKTTYEIIDPRTEEPLVDDKGNVATLTLWGPDSSVIKNVEKQFRKSAEEKAFKNRKKESMLNYALDLQRRKAVAAVCEWENIGWDGKELECTPANVKLVFDNLPWIEEQVKVFISDRVNFMKS